MDLARFCTVVPGEALAHALHGAKVIGTGEFGVVRQGRLPAFGNVAIKTIGTQREEVYTEIEMLAKSQGHRNIISLLAAAHQPGFVHIVMPLFQMTLRDSISKLNWGQRYSVSFQLSQGLAWLHDHGIIHRDCKSSNIMVDICQENETVYACWADFGITATSSQEGPVGGTEDYLAPECFDQGRARDRISYSPKHDVYAFGVVLAEVLSGKPPAAFFEGLAKVSILAWFEQQHWELSDIIDPAFRADACNKYTREVEHLLFTIEQCTLCGMNDRPSMSQVVASFAQAWLGPTTQPRNCKVCMETPISTVFPCGHACCCHTCTSLLLERGSAAVPFVGEPLDGFERANPTSPLLQNTFIGRPRVEPIPGFNRIRALSHDSDSEWQSGSSEGSSSIESQENPIDIQDKPSSSNTDLDAIIRGMDSVENDPTVQQDGCQALHSLACEGDHIRKSLMTKAVDQLVIRAMDKFQTNQTIQKTACMLVANLACGGYEIRTKLVLESIDDRVIYAMENFKDNREIQQMGCLALKNLALGAVGNKRILASKSAQCTITRAIKNFPNDPVIQGAARGAL
eukprot:CAMPEP_0203789552 /NCGR_PEP_ID=MMETSP0100_2-20121128/3514_1 /ASSEMBLY_ACC=CAM_ASM_000210 /TAXON_ID=96639 /ORGANISM=" , Strain NY0313808BC1" /LENGTH=569 /DNA_ID=CAMNT_0050692515 /DNA_START=1640 /DNA_END=3345 /DNA_ORIENTATION=+